MGLEKAQKGIFKMSQEGWCSDQEDFFFILVDLESFPYLDYLMCSQESSHKLEEMKNI